LRPTSFLYNSVQNSQIWCPGAYGNTIGNQMKWRGNYRGGEIELEAQTQVELDKQVDAIQASRVEPDGRRALTVEMPALAGNLGCNDAIRSALASTWGRNEPRSMTELQQAFEANALFFSAGTLSGALTYLTKNGTIRRIDKDGKWAYILAASNDK